MENAAEALKMAAAMLIFVLALTISINSLTLARQTTESVLLEKDRETHYINGNYYYDSTGVTTRKVGLETIIPTIYRALNENTKIIFYQGKNANLSKAEDFTGENDSNNNFPCIYTYKKEVTDAIRG